MRKALLGSDLRAFGALLHEGWQAKKRISSKISTPFIDQAYQAAIENGALGGKVTGAGGGGFLLLFCEEEHQEKVRQALGELGIREMAFGLDFEGARVVANDPFIDGDEKCGMRWTFAPASAG
jgi:D-glycero-alpha-D-manno-heptose-7-phosphate kinase